MYDHNTMINKETYLLYLSNKLHELEHTNQKAKIFSNMVKAVILVADAEGVLRESEGYARNKACQDIDA